jgi:hypothetical protein
MPSDHLLKLKDLALEFRPGYQLREAVQPASDGAHALVQLGNVRDGVIVLQGLARMTLGGKTGTAVRLNHFVRDGDILLRGRGATYGAALVSEVPENAVALSPLFLLRVKPDVVPEYLVWYINRPATQAILRSVQRGTVIPSVNSQAFGGLEIALPSLSVQRQVAEIAGLAREERRLAERLAQFRERQVEHYLEKLVND